MNWVYRKVINQAEVQEIYNQFESMPDALVKHNEQITEFLNGSSAAVATYKADIDADGDGQVDHIFNVKTVYLYKPGVKFSDEIPNWTNSGMLFGSLYSFVPEGKVPKMLPEMLNHSYSLHSMNFTLAGNEDLIALKIMRRMVGYLAVNTADVLSRYKWEGFEDPSLFMQGQVYIGNIDERVGDEVIIPLVGPALGVYSYISLPLNPAERLWTLWG